MERDVLANACRVLASGLVLPQAIGEFLHGQPSEA